MLISVVNSKWSRIPTPSVEEEVVGSDVASAHVPWPGKPRYQERMFGQAIQ
jgi:hypothetical protein